MAGKIKEVKILGYDFVFVLRHRYEKDNENKLLDNHTMWREWELGFFFKRKKGAFKRNLEFDLSFNEFYELLMGNCYYCKSKPREHKGGKPYQVKALPPLKRNGIDRLDSSIGYVNGNVVSCCTNCNYAKHEMSINEFKEWIKKIYFNFVNL